MKAKIRAELERVLADRPYIFRQDKQRQSIDGLSAGVLSNMDAAGLGPAEKVMIGRKVAYPTTDYINFVIGRVSDVVKTIRVRIEK
jgi:hypothetical protein